MSTLPTLSDLSPLCEPCMHQESGANVIISSAKLVHLGNAVAGASEVFRLLQKSSELRALREACDDGEISARRVGEPLCDVAEYGLFRALESLLHSVQLDVEWLEMRSAHNSGPTVPLSDPIESRASPGKGAAPVSKTGGARSAQ